MRIVRCLPLLLPLALAVPTFGGPTKGGYNFEDGLEAPPGRFTRVEHFRGGERACVVVMGERIGLAVLDAQEKVLATGDSAGNSRFLERAISPSGSYFDSASFDAGQKACAIAVCRGPNPVGLYVYDAEGNCIAHDDLGNSRTQDYAAVDWIAPQKATYTLEVRNLGASANEFLIDWKSGAKLSTVIWYPPRDTTYTIQFTNPLEKSVKCFVAFK